MEARRRPGAGGAWLMDGFPCSTPWLLAGPTASGKSAVALVLAERLRGEILSADSMQVYQGMDIGTAKPTRADQARVPHHLIDLVPPNAPFSVADWLPRATRMVGDIVARGRTPIFCGGTGLYFRAWLHGLDEPAPVDAGRRAALESRSLPDLLEELRARDPARWERVDRSNPRRVVRALEAVLDGGAGPVSRIPPGGDPVTDRVLVLRRTAEDLRGRIHRRVDAMFEAGLVEETRGLMGRGLGGNRTAMQAIGYRQVVDHLEGRCDLSAAVWEVKKRTWQLARRQMTWFRHQLPVTWVDVPADATVDTIAERLLRMGNGEWGMGSGEW